MRLRSILCASGVTVKPKAELLRIADVTKGETFGYLDRQNVTWFDQGYVDAIIAACNADN